MKKRVAAWRQTNSKESRDTDAMRAALKKAPPESSFGSTGLWGRIDVIGFEKALAPGDYRIWVKGEEKDGERLSSNRERFSVGG